MSNTSYYMVCTVLSLGVLAGIHMMSRVKSAKWGNGVSALCMLAAVCVTLYKYSIFSAREIWIGLALGVLIGVIFTVKVEMITMPQTVALLNGLGGAASAIAAMLTLTGSQARSSGLFVLITAAIALAVGSFTFSGSVIAAGKLHKVLPQKPCVLPGHQFFTTVTFLGTVASTVLLALQPDAVPVVTLAVICALISLLFGIFFAVRVGGADMPITISLLNSTSGVAAAIAGMALGDILLVSVGGIVGASGLLLTQIMCKAMNRSLAAILFSKVQKAGTTAHVPPHLSAKSPNASGKEAQKSADVQELPAWLSQAQDIIIIPGYGMALSQAQGLVKQLADKLEAANKCVRFAIHPVAGRMPGHMNVLLCEVDIPYDKLYEMDVINPDFEKADLAIVVGASDVINPAANTAEGTPIYGMPVLKADKVKRLIICNFDLRPGYAGVPNPLYEPNPHTMLLLGDAKESLADVLKAL